MSIAAVITITSWNESPFYAVKSVLSNRKYVKELHFIFPGYDEQEEKDLYLEWPSDRKILEQSNIKIQFDARLKADNFEDPELLLVEIPPNCSMKLGDFELLSSKAKQSNEQQTHLGIGSSINLNEFSPWYGFLVILAVMEWVMNLFFNRKIYQYTDIRARFIMSKGKYKFLPLQHTILSYFWNPYTMKKEYSNAAIEQGKSTPREITRWILWSHETFKFGLWILPYICVYIFITISWLSILSNFLSFSWIISTASLAVWFVEFLVAFFVTNGHIKVKYHIILCALFPVYWILFPFVFASAKFLSN